MKWNIIIDMKVQRKANEMKILILMILMGIRKMRKWHDDINDNDNVSAEMLRKQ